PWPGVREQVARGAARSLAGDSLSADAQRALASLVRDTAAHVRVNAVRSAASYGATARVALLAALNDIDVNVRVAVAQSLDPAIGGDTTAWFHAFDGDTTLMVRRSLAEGAIKHGINLAERAHWTTSGDWQLRALAAELAGAGPAEAAAKRLTPWLRDPDGRVRAVAAGSLAALADSASVRASTRTQLRVALADSDVGVRTSSLGALTRGATPEDLAFALVAYRQFLGDSDNDARLSFWRLADSALARAGPRLPDSLARALAMLPRPSDPLERARAAAIPRFLGWKDVTSTGRALSWYQSRAEEAFQRPSPTLRIQTERGTMDLALFASEAPLTVYNVVTLAYQGYFDGQRFHRVVPNFVVQGGDPRGDGNGGPGYAIRDELNRRRYGRGTLGMALSGPNTGGSQFFITLSPQPHLDGGYTVFGELVRGFEVLDRIVQGDRIVRVTVH
ncbi:MAG: peptidylprolyl isomerase, partial [Gemmatimonadota bacterium]|nr:peptidylprolyl isomerase [Gemmatimonadota bacterium]